MIIGAIVAGIFGFLIGIPVMRLQGDYLAIVTLAFGEIIKNVMNTIYIGLDAEGLKLSMLSSAALNLVEGGKTIINGPMGAVGIKKLSTFTAGFVLILITLFIVLNLINSRAGRAIMAVRDNKIAAESLGISVWRYRMMAFITSATLAGAAGALYALNYSTVIARKFDFNTSILVLVFVVLGGMGNIRGSIIAATILTVLPEVLRAFNDIRMLAYAVILIPVSYTHLQNLKRRKIFHAGNQRSCFVDQTLKHIHLKRRLMRCFVFPHFENVDSVTIFRIDADDIAIACIERFHFFGGRQQILCQGVALTSYRDQLPVHCKLFHVLPFPL